MEQPDTVNEWVLTSGEMAREKGEEENTMEDGTPILDTSQAGFALHNRRPLHLRLFDLS
jgi:hypothetical protein